MINQSSVTNNRPMSERQPNRMAHRSVWMTRLTFLLLCCLPLWSNAAEFITYYHLDAQGSPVAATDESGKVIWREDYQPHGKRQVLEDNGGNRVGYTGALQEGFGLNYHGARWYDPSIGRFMGVDPAGFQEGDAQSFNGYVYANNNPYKYVDPNGEFAQFIIWGGMALLTTYDMMRNDPVPGHEQDGISTVITMPGPIGLGGKAAAKVGEEVVERAAKGVAKSSRELKSTLIQENPRNLIPTQTKAEMSGSQVKRLSKDMKQNGFDQSKPVDAWRNPNTGRLEIQDGHHRVEAAKSAGLNKIPVQVGE